MPLFLVTTPGGWREQYFGSDAICLVCAIVVSVITYFGTLFLIRKFAKNRL